MITFVTWKWTQPGHERTFQASYVQVLNDMIARNYHKPYRFVCITDDTTGLEDLETLPLPPHKFDDVASPHGTRFPSCYRRLWNFSMDARRYLGPVIVALDIDVIITADLGPLLDDRSESFIGWTDERPTWAKKVAGGLYMLRTGMHAHVWNDFCPVDSPKMAAVAGLTGSDQAWMSFCLYPPPGRFTVRDGVYSSKWLEPGKPLPHNCRIVSTPGKLKPWHSEFQTKFPWVKKHWRMGQ